ncbi:transglycosylase family protein [Rhodanobacter denitrificans]|uniref:Transglycosylase family protein n=2 Tax=Rhodanobacter denitrificans TaxID=666685 RepID=M4NEC5_9GAMM|nr:transglycosylase family protein [Rhodanobacter denitrificans]
MSSPAAFRARLQRCGYPVAPLAPVHWRSARAVTRQSAATVPANCWRTLIQWRAVVVLTVRTVRQGLTRAQIAAASKRCCALLRRSFTQCVHFSIRPRAALIARPGMPVRPVLMDPALPVLWRPRGFAGAWMRLRKVLQDGQRTAIRWGRRLDVTPRVRQLGARYAMNGASALVAVVVTLYLPKITHTEVEHSPSATPQHGLASSRGRASVQAPVPVEVARRPQGSATARTINGGAAASSLPTLVVFADEGPQLDGSDRAASANGGGAAAHANLDITDPHSVWYRAGADHGIDPLLLYAIALVESRNQMADGTVAPRAYVVNIDNVVRYGTRAEIVDMIHSARTEHRDIRDVGIMQVFWPSHRDLAPDPVALLDPTTNINVGAEILRGALASSVDPVTALGHYHSYDATRASYYGRAVYTVYHRLQRALGRLPSSELASTERAVPD